MNNLLPVNVFILKVLIDEWYVPFAQIQDDDLEVFKLLEMRPWFLCALPHLTNEIQGVQSGEFEYVYWSLNPVTSDIDGP